MKFLTLTLLLSLLFLVSGQPKADKALAEDTLNQEDILGTKSAFELGMEIDSKLMAGSSTQELPKKAEKESRVLIVIKKKINLRESPTTGAQIIAKLSAGTELNKIGEKSNWYKVTDGTHSGFVRDDMLAWSNELTKRQSDFIGSVVQAEKEKQMAEKLAQKRHHETQKKLEDEKNLAAKLKADKLRIEQEAQEKIKIEKQRLAQQKEEAFKREQARLAEEIRKKEESEKQSRIIRKKKYDEARIEKLLTLKKEKEDKEKRQAEIIRVERENQMKLLLEKKKKDEEIKRKNELKKKEKVVYSSFGRRDPFVKIEPVSLNESDLNIDQMKLVGIIWDQDDPLAVLEHSKEAGISVTLREGDRIANGKVAYINYEKITFEILEYGVYRSYTLKLVD